VGAEFLCNIVETAFQPMFDNVLAIPYIGEFLEPIFRSIILGFLGCAPAA
jgi:hypothetical protein